MRSSNFKVHEQRSYSKPRGDILVNPPPSRHFMLLPPLPPSLSLLPAPSSHSSFPVERDNERENSADKAATVPTRLLLSGSTTRQGHDERRSDALYYQRVYP